MFAIIHIGAPKTAVQKANEADPISVKISKRHI
jgi:hypothetical protein